MSSGLNWNIPATLERADPYLAWADLTGYASYRLPSEPDTEGWWLVLIELAPGKKRSPPIDRLLRTSEPGWLQVPDVYTDKRVKRRCFRYCTARVGRRFFQEVLAGSLSKVVMRYRLCTPVEYPVTPFRHKHRPNRKPFHSKRALAGASGKQVMAFVDGGLAFANAAFLDKGRPRVAHYWRQDDHLGSRYLGDRIRTQTPASLAAPWRRNMELGYGAELDRQAIKAALDSHTHRHRLDEEGVYRQLGLWDLDRRVHHGTHVASLAAGPFRYPRQPGGGDIPPFWIGAEGSDPHGSHCDLLAVQLAWANILDTSCRSCDAYILDALMYAMVRTHSAAHLVVNLSWGGNAGPHDGSSILEMAMLDWCDLRGAPTQIVVPSGNTYQARMHANAVVKANQVLELTWRIPPESRTPNFLELWFEKRTADLSIELTAPDGRLMVLKASQLKADILSSQGKPVATLVLVNDSYLGRGPMALFAIEPTAGVVAPAPCGQWGIKVSSSEEVAVDAFVERNDEAIGLHTGAKQAYLEASGYNTGSGRDLPIHPTHATSNSSVVRRRGSFNHLSCGSDARRVFSVGGLVYQQTRPRTIPAAPYSPPWDGTPQKRRRRANTKEAPDAVAISEASTVMRGLRGSGVLSGSVVRLAGTSSAVPQVVRLLINGEWPFPEPLPPIGIWE